MPFGKKVELNFRKHPIANVIWALVGGWAIAIAYLGLGILNCITIIGIPNGIQWTMPVATMPSRRLIR